jgi:xanthine dehydrogenase/oxidase
MKSFAVDEMPIDIEDLSDLKCLSETNSACINSNAPSSIKEFYLTRDGKEWFAPISLADLSLICDRFLNKNIRFLSGSTGFGVYKKDGPFDVFVDLKRISELQMIEKTQEHLIVGSNISLNQLVDLLNGNSSQIGFSYFKVLADSLKKVANEHVRNVASWAGNLAMKLEHPEFESDVLVILESADAVLNVLKFRTDNKEKKIIQYRLDEFLRDKELNPGHYIIHSIKFSRMDCDSTEINIYKIGARMQNAHAHVSCGFRINLDKVDHGKVQGKTYS